MKDMEKIIAEQRFFKDMPKEFRATIAGCGTMAVYEPGQFMFKAGDQATHFFLIRDGNVGLELQVPGSEVFRFQTVGEGEIIGWSWIFEPFVYQFDARTLEKTRVVSFDGRCLRGKCDADAELGFYLMKRFSKVMVRRLAATRMQLIDVYGNR